MGVSNASCFLGVEAIQAELFRFQVGVLTAVGVVLGEGESDLIRFLVGVKHSVGEVDGT